MRSVPAGRPETPVYEHRWAALFVLLAALFMDTLDTTIVNIGLATVQRSTGASDEQLQWVVEVYVLTYALGFLPLARLGDILGRKRTIMVGMSAFTALSALCGLAPTAGWLIFARALQGLFAAMISSQVMPLAQSLFQPKERPRVFPLIGLTGGMSGIAGPLIGGLLLQANFFDLSWRWLYLINIPVGIATLIGAAVFVPRTEPRTGLKNDWLGIALVALAVWCLMFPLVEGRAMHWPLWSFLMMAGAAVLTIAFIAWERRQARVGGSALVPVYLWANRDYRIGCAAILVLSSAVQGFFLVFALFLQQGIGFTSLQTGVTTVWFPIGLLLASLMGTRLLNSRMNLVCSCAVLVGAFASIILVLQHVPAASFGVLTFGLPMLFGGVALGLAIAALFQIVMRTVPMKDAGAGSGVAQVIQQIGGAIGIAVLAAVFFSGTSAEHADRQSAYEVALVNTILCQLVAFAFVGAAALRIMFSPAKPASSTFAPVSSGAAD